MFRSVFEINKDLSGTDPIYSEVLDLNAIGGDNVEATLVVNSLTGGGSLTVTPQYSYNGIIWFDDMNSFTVATGATTGETINMVYAGQEVRFKYVLTGSNPTANIDLFARASVGGGNSGAVSGGGGGGGSTTINNLAAELSDSDTVAADTTAGGTSVVAANNKRVGCEFTNNGAVDAYYGTGTVTSTFQIIVPGQTKLWNSQEELKVLASSGSVNISYVDYYNS